MPTIIRSPEGYSFDNVYKQTRSSSPNGSVKKQKRNLKKLIRKHNLVPYSEVKCIDENISGKIIPSDRFLNRIDPNSLIYVANYDRISKLDDIPEITDFRRTMVKRNIKVISFPSEYKTTGHLLNLIEDSDPDALPFYIQMISNRIAEAIEVESRPRVALEPYCDNYLHRIQSGFVGIKKRDLRRWILISYTGSLINEYQTKLFEYSRYSRTPRFKIRKVWVVHRIDQNHLKKQENDINLPDLTLKEISALTRSYKCYESPSSVSKIRSQTSISTAILNECTLSINDPSKGVFGKDVEAVYNQLVPYRSPTSWDGVNPEEKRILQALPKRYAGLYSWQIGSRSLLNDGNNVVTQTMAGGGKSLVYILSALRGMRVLVICPSIKLIYNQISSIRSNFPDLRVACITKDTKAKERSSIMRQIERGTLDMLFVNPEQLDEKKSSNAPATRSVLQGWVSLIVVDEGHHQKLDGFDFRSSYKFQQIRRVRKQLGNPQTLFTSASLTEASHLNIRMTLKGEELKIVRGELYRPNVALFKKMFEGKTAQEEKTTWLVSMVRYMKEALGIKKIIVYVNQHKRVMNVMKDLKDTGNQNVWGVHGQRRNPKIGLSNEKVSINQRLFENSKTGIMVATSSYAEGIDVEVGAVIVLDMPLNIETLYQELLRTGHQGQPGLGFVCVDEKAHDFNRFSLLKNDDRKVKAYNQMFKFLDEDKDLWKAIVEPFGGKVPGNKK